MPYRETYDVIIAGAGPGGSLLGYLLSSNGLNVLILEKESFPRYKPCGGGLTKKTLDILPFDVVEAVDAVLYTTGIFVGCSPVFIKTSDDPILWMVMRDRFDHFLVKKAVAAGAVFHEKTAFKSLSGKAESLQVETSDGTFSTKLLAGADGVNGNAARALGLTVKRSAIIALEGEVYFSNPDKINDFRHTACFDFGVIPNGYGWIFPKSDHLSVGLMTASKKIKNLKHYFSSYLERKTINNLSEVRMLKGRLIPCRPDIKNIIANRKGLLVGDAAGFADPVTGEGIYYAGRQAVIASEVILTAFNKGFDYIEEYNSIISKEFADELNCAGKLSYILYGFPKFSRRMLRSYGRQLGEYLIDIISGRRTYRELYNKIFTLSGISSILFSYLRK